MIIITLTIAIIVIIGNHGHCLTCSGSCLCLPFQSRKRRCCECCLRSCRSRCRRTASEPVHDIDSKAKVPGNDIDLHSDA